MNPTALIAEALAALDVHRLVLGVFAQSFPASAGEDLGRGSPYSASGARLLDFAADLGFNGVQLGPMGLTTASNPSPYDAALFSRNPLDLGLAQLADEGWVSAQSVARVAAAAPARSQGRVSYAHAWQAHLGILDELWATWRRGAKAPLEGFDAFRAQNQAWLVPDGLYDCLFEAHGGRWHGAWGDTPEGALDQRLFDPHSGEEAAVADRLAQLEAAHANDLERAALLQFLLQGQHQALRGHAARRALTLYGDLQIGVSTRDTWAHQRLFLRDYLMGAPPSRTNPEGQPWGYPVLDPAGYDGAAGDFLRARVTRLFAEFDALRVDHPHGLIDPWVYQAGTADPLRAVQTGARLFSSPSTPGHPALAAFAIARPEQLDRSQTPYADDRVTGLDDAQVTRYGALFDVLAQAALANHRDVRGLVCEVLSTQPLPLRKVLERRGLGRFRVTQKANLRDPADVYRSENAAPADWVMLGNHDTSTIWAAQRRWAADGTLPAQAAYLAERLAPEPGTREAFARKLLEAPGLLVQAHLAALFASPARNVQIFFTDLLGLEAPFNQPGTSTDDNWSLRVPPDYASTYSADSSRNAALHLPRALALALRARGQQAGRQALIEALERLP
jgi:4-alpha-glucanotransferase